MTPNRNFSNSTRPLVAVGADLKDFDDYRWHAAPEQYLDALSTVAGVQPLIVPSLGIETDIAAILDHVEGVLVTGSRSNIHPARYGIEATPGHEPFDEARDATALPLIVAALARGLPLFAICRGMQELNVALGGTIAAEIQDIHGRFDHRAPESEDQAARFAIRHEVSIRPGSRLEAILGGRSIRVNSVHRQGIDRLADALDIEATAEDGTIEAVGVRDAAGFALGVQWHPEYWAGSDTPSRRLFEAFGGAVREARAGQRPAAPAAGRKVLASD